MARNIRVSRCQGGALMTRFLKRILGLMWFGAGAAVLYANSAAIILAMNKGGGMSLFYVGGMLIGSCCLGAAADCFGWMQPTQEPEKGNVANSVWATPEHLATYNILED